MKTVEVEPGLWADMDHEWGVWWRRAENCQQHGPFEARGHVFRATDLSERPTRWSTKCPKCGEEEELKRKRLKREQQEQARLQATIDRAGIPRNFQEASMDNYIASNDGQRKALEIARNFAHDFPKAFKSGRSLLLLGNVGNGKTHLAVAIAYEVMQQGYSAIITTTADMLARITSTWGQPEGGAEREALIQQHAHVPLLIIDELGGMKCRGREREILYRILATRHAAMLPTVFTGNLTRDELPEYIGAQIVSRLRESASTVVGFDWEDYRPIKARMAA